MTGRRTWAVGVGIAVLAALAYAPSLTGPFIFDDIHHIVDNPGIRSFGTVFDSGLQETRPLFLYSLAVNYAVGELDPIGYRLVNLALHVGCALLLLALARAAARDLDDDEAWFPAIAAGLFAVHPMATESVAYVNSRSGVLAACFGLAAIVLYLRWDRMRADGVAKRPLALTYAGSIACMALAMLSKESGVVAPALLVAYLWLIRGRGARAMVAALPLVACAAIVPLLFAVVDSPHRGTIGADTLPVLDHALTQLRVVPYLFALCVVPFGHNLDYDFGVSTGVDAAVVGGFVAIAAMVAAMVALRRRAPVVSLGVAWFFLAIAPTNSLVPFVDFIAERHVYTALMGVCLGLGWLASRAVARRRAFGAVVGLVVAVFALLTLARASVLADPLALWSETVASSPDKARPHVNLGILLIGAGEWDEGGAHLVRAVELNPRDARAQFNLGVFYERAGRPHDALAAVRAASALAPERRTYRAELARMANNAGIAHVREQDLAGAEIAFREAIAARPGYAVAHANLAEVLLRKGARDEAIEHLRRAVEIDPGYAKAREKLEALGGGGR